MIVASSPFLARFERFPAVGSTNDVVRAWLRDDTPEVALAVADEQSAGRGREGRRWVAPAGAALLLSAGFRPHWLEPERTWRLGAIVGLAMAQAAESVTGLAPGTIRLKWPNDLVVAGSAGDGDLAGLRKLAGVLGESEGLGTDDPRVVVGIGINADWRGTDFPPDLAGTMTSLREVAGGPVDRFELLDAFLVGLETAVVALRGGDFDEETWRERQVTTGHDVRLDLGDRAMVARAIGVDGPTGALIVADPAARDGQRLVHAGEIHHLRLGETPDPRVGV